MSRALGGEPRLPGRVLLLVAGLFGWAVAIALMIRSGLGLGPWDAFHVGLHHVTSLSVGTANIATGLVILAGSLLLRMRPGPGTLANMVLIGVFVDVLLPRTPAASGWLGGLLYYGVALVLVGVCSGMYIGARLGAGPRDSLMLALSERHGWPVRRVRTAIELAALGAGWMMGGQVGLGTVLFAVCAGPSVQWGLRLFGALPAPPSARTEPPDSSESMRRAA